MCFPKETESRTSHGFAKTNKPKKEIARTCEKRQINFHFRITLVPASPLPFILSLSCVSGVGSFCSTARLFAQQMLEMLYVNFSRNDSSFNQFADCRTLVKVQFSNFRGLSASSFAYNSSLVLCPAEKKCVTSSKFEVQTPKQSRDKLVTAWQQALL